MLTFDAAETVTIVRGGTPTGTDRYSDPIPGPDTSTDVPGCLVAPASSTEPVAVDRNAVITTDTVYMPAGTDVRATDRLVIRGNPYEVVGDPAVWSTAGVVVACKRKAG